VKKTPLALLLLALWGGGCAGADPQALTFWAMGGEGEQVEHLLAPFRAAHPEIHLAVQGIPWDAAHDKLLTAFAGDVTPDVCQLGTTWVSELAALGALAPLDERLKATPDIDSRDYFAGPWAGDRVDGQMLALPWYAETRALFYRKDLLAAHGFDHPPANWEEFFTIAKALTTDANHYGAFLPPNPASDPVPLYMAWQQRADVLDLKTLHGTARSPAFANAVSFYARCFSSGVAPREQGMMTNFYQAFAAGTMAMFISGPWNVAALRERQPGLTSKWGVAILPGTNGRHTSIAGGSALAIFKHSRHQDAAWALVHFLSQSTVQRDFYHLTNDLPARKSAWTGPELTDDTAKAFYAQLQDARPAPAVPEWEQVAARLGGWVEKTVYGRTDVKSALEGLDSEVDALLEKRRWLSSRHKEGHV
jgi:multiple sugar transport system substrate-binding protein